MESSTENNLNGNNSIEDISEEHKKLATGLNLFQKEVMMELLLRHYFLQVVSHTMFTKSKFYLEKCAPTNFWIITYIISAPGSYRETKDTYAGTSVCSNYIQSSGMFSYILYEL